MMSPKLIAALIATILMTALIVIGTQTALRWREGAIQNEARGQVLTAASGITADGVKADVHSEQVDTGIAEGRSAYETSIERARTNEPTTRVYGDTAIPDSVRNAARERRLSRERLGRATRERAAQYQADDAAKR